MGKLIIAHRGLSAVCPENTLVSFAAAQAAGADEIELDIWGTEDGELAVIHDDRIDRTTNGTGLVSQLSWDYLETLDASAQYDSAWRGIRLCRFSDVCSLFGRSIVMNLHIHQPGDRDWVVAKVIETVTLFDLKDRVYISGWEPVLSAACSAAPDIQRCSLSGGEDNEAKLEAAVTWSCSRVQFFSSGLTQDLIDRAKQHGLFVQVFYCDTCEEMMQYYHMGADAVLTNTAHQLIADSRRFDRENI